MEDLLRCISVLYGGNCTNSAQLHAANEWLTMFQQREDAYQLCVDLLVQSRDSVLPPGLLFYSLHTITRSIRMRKNKQNSSGSEPDSIVVFRF